MKGLEKTNRSTHSDRFLFDGRNWQQDIEASGVVQSGYADCCFESALASLADTRSGKATIKNMIAHNDDDSYTVKFPGDRSHPIKVSQADVANENIADNARWAKVIESAYIKYVNHNRTPLDPEHSFLNEQGVPPLAHGAGPREALRLLTGEDVSVDQFAITDLGSQQLTLGITSRENVADDLKHAAAAGEPVTAAASPDFAKYILGHAPGPLEAGHQYSVLSFNPNSLLSFNPNSLLSFNPTTESVIVRNPWGSASIKPVSNGERNTYPVTNLGGGKLKMSLTTFMHYFSDITVAGKNPYLNDLGHVANDFVRSLELHGAAASSFLTSAPNRAAKNFGHALETDAAFVGETTHLVMQPISDLLTAIERGVYGIGSATIGAAIDKFDQCSHRISGTNQ